jgi:anti-sigma regulatory factor (Ser/Thr protein kinase)
MPPADSDVDDGAVRTVEPGERSELVIPADRRAPATARTLIGACFGGVLDPRTVEDAKLLISELVTNSLVHGGLGSGDTIVVALRLDADTLRIEVRNPGVHGAVARGRGTPGRSRSRGYGLDLVALLGTTWGVLRGDDTCVWVEMARA